MRPLFLPLLKGEVPEGRRGNTPERRGVNRKINGEVTLRRRDTVGTRWGVSAEDYKNIRLGLIFALYVIFYI